MLCRRCRPLTDPPGPELKLGPRAAEQGADRFRTLICSSCGGLIPANDPLHATLGKLARFGLDSEGRPLLKPATEDR